jgi:hypothetical protein
MRSFAVLLALAAAMPVAAQTHDPRISREEADADRIEAQQMYDLQKQRDQAEADRVAKTNLDRKTDYELYLARQKAEHEAKMAAWRAEVARQQAQAARERADWEARVARCQAGDRSACAPK